MDILTLPHYSHCAGRIRLPGSKSIANRALLLAALADGETRLHNLLDSDDTRHMRHALRLLDVRIEEPAVLADGVVRVSGQGGLFNIAQTDTPLELFLGNAGTAMRPLAAVLAFSQGYFHLTGEPRMGERPIGPLVDALQQLGAEIEYLAAEGYPPLAVKGASFNGHHVCIDGSLSSQFISALFMVLPFNTQDTHVTLTGELVSLPYIELTLALMQRFGVDVKRLSAREFCVPGQTGYRSPGDFLVEGDASGASYFLAAAAIAGGTVRVEGTGRQSLQGDTAFADILQTMGAQVTWGDHFIEVTGAPLNGGVFDLNAIPDAAMTIATTALFAKGPTEIRNVYNWRLKETDRLSAMATELRKTGAGVVEGEDYLRIEPPENILPARIATYDDHRMAMCFALLAFAPSGVSIEDPDCCRKTYPDFFADFDSICYASDLS